MKEGIQESAKRLKLSWIREHYHEVNETDPETFLLKLFENEIQQRDERRINLLLKTATLPNITGKPFDWQDVQLSQGLDQSTLLEGKFIEKKRKHDFLWRRWGR